MRQFYRTRFSGQKVPVGPVKNLWLNIKRKIGFKYKRVEIDE